MTTLMPYPMDNASPHAPRHHTALAALLDPFTQERVRGLGGVAGLRCLEVGAGGGSVARWLADEVGSGGYVLATDLKPQHIPVHHRLGVTRHDLVTEPLPAERYGFIHARLVLGHLPERRAILHRLVGVLAPGGVLLIEDWDASRTDVVLAAPDAGAAELYTRFQRTLGERVFSAHGTDRTWGRQVHGALLDEGLTEVQTVMHATAWPGGSPGCRLVAAVLPQVRADLLAAGMTAEELDRVRALLDDPRLVLSGHPLFSTSGRAPR